MIPEYEKHIPEIENALAELGMKLSENEDFFSVFRSPEGWTVKFLGDFVSRPAYAFFVSHESWPRERAMRFVMDAYEQVENVELPPHDVSSTLAFITRHWDFIAEQTEIWIPIYEKLNTLPHGFEA